MPPDQAAAAQRTARRAGSKDLPTLPLRFGRIPLRPARPRTRPRRAPRVAAGFTPRPRRRSPSSSSPSSTGMRSGRSRLPLCCTPAPRRCCSSHRIWQGAEQLLRISVQSANPAGKGVPRSELPAWVWPLLFQVPQIDPVSRKAEVLRCGQTGAGPAGRGRFGSDGWSISEPSGCGQEPRHHQEVHAANQLHAEGVL